MQQPVFYTAGHSDALCRARNLLQQWGYAVSPTPGTEVTHLLLPVPSFDSPGILKGGQRLESVLQQLSETVTVFGGNLPDLPYPCRDMLKDEFYLCENAGITAQCAVKILQQKCTLSGASVLVIGWGRIGKRLLPLLKEHGAAVTIALRKEKDLHFLQVQGESAVLTALWQPNQYDIVINTAPAAVLNESQCKQQAILMDLASVQGIEGENVLWARGLPGKYAPEASGTLIAKTALRYALGKEHL